MTARGGQGGKVPQPVRRAGARPTPVGWVLLDGGSYTIRWRRGDPVAYVLSGDQVGSHGMVGVLDTVAVLTSGWTDFAEIRQVGQRWLGQQRTRQK